jgi:hypothetical protein
MENAYVVAVETVDTGGGEPVDIITLASGMAITITEDCMVVYPGGKEAFYAALNGDIVQHSVIY